MTQERDDLSNVLEALLDAFYNDPDEIRMLAVLNCLRAAKVLPGPVTPTAGKPGVWQKVYSNRKQCKIELTEAPVLFRELLMRVSSDTETAGVILDADTHPFHVPRSFFDLVIGA